MKRNRIENLSVVITTFNRGNQLLSLLKTLDQNRGINQFEVLVVNNNSTDNTLKHLAEFKPINFQLKVITEVSKGPSFCRNLGIDQCRFKSVVLLDDDVEVSDNFVEKWLSLFETYPNATLIGGKTTATTRDNINLTWVKAKLFHHRWLIAETQPDWTMAKELVCDEMMYSACMGINLAKLGQERFDGLRFGRYYGSQIIFAEDYELCTRLILSGHQLIFDPQMEVRHHILASRLGRRQLFNRLWLAGVERRIMDDKFRTDVNYKTNRITLAKYSYILKEILKSENNYSWFDLYAEWIHDSGYILGMGWNKRSLD